MKKTLAQTKAERFFVVERDTKLIALAKKTNGRLLKKHCAPYKTNIPSDHTRDICFVRRYLREKITML